MTKYNDKRRLGGNDLARRNQTLRQDPVLTAVGTVSSIATGNNLTGGPITGAGTIDVSVTKSGATQIAATAVAGELWYTVSHATLPDNVILVGV